MTFRALSGQGPVTCDEERNTVQLAGSTQMGDLILRRRRIAMLDGLEVYEVKLGERRGRWNGKPPDLAGKQPTAK